MILVNSCSQIKRLRPNIRLTNRGLFYFFNRFFASNINILLIYLNLNLSDPHSLLLSGWPRPLGLQIVLKPVNQAQQCLLFLLIQAARCATGKGISHFG